MTSDGSTARTSGPAVPSAAEATPAGPGTAAVATTAVVVIVTLLLGAVLVAAQRPGAGLLVGAAAPDFVLPAVDDRGDVALADLRGQPLVLTFWASWCTTCKADVPKLQRIVDGWGPRGVTVLGVVIDDTVSAAHAAAEEVGATYRSGFDGDGTTRDAYAVRGTPETFLIDAEGRIAATWIGPLPEHELTLRLATMIGSD